MGNTMYTVVYLVAILAFFYFMLIRPQKKKSKELDEMRNSLKIGDTVVTIGGINGKVTKILDEEVVIKSGDVKLTMSKWGIGSIETDDKNDAIEE